MSVVYLAEDLRLRRKVALKLMAPALAEDEAFRERFLEESELAASLDHPGVVPIYAAGEAHGRLFIAMRYVEGSDLKELLRQGPLTPERTVAICAQVADALVFAHERGLVHRDVKPSNVLLDRREHGYLADFGLTKRLADPRIPEAGLSGTIDYIAPEQIRGDDLDGRVDVYSLGCLLYECLSGQQPFRRSTDAAVLFAHLEEEPPVLPRLEDVLPKALAKDPDERYGTCGELVEAAGVGLGLSAPSRARWWRAPAVLALAGVAVIALALAAVNARRDGGGGPASTGAWLVRIDPKARRVATRVPTGPEPTGVAVGGGAVWATSFKQHSVWRFDPRTLQVQKTSVSAAPTGITVGGGDAFVSDGNSSQFTVTRLAAATGARLDQAIVDANVVASGAAGVWAAGHSTVTRLEGGLNPSTGASSEFNGASADQVQFPYPVNELHIRYQCSGIAVGKGRVWVIGDSNDRRLVEISQASSRIVATTRIPGSPDGAAAGEGAVWVTDQLDDVVWRVDAAQPSIMRAVKVGREPQGIAAGAGAVWVANTVDGTVPEVDPVSDRVIATIPVGAGAQWVAVGDGSVWVTTHEGAPS